VSWIVVGRDEPLRGIPMGVLFKELGPMVERGVDELTLFQEGMVFSV
jgi:hypothetical protein